MIPSPGLEIEIFVTNSKPEIARMSRAQRMSTVNPQSIEASAAPAAGIDEEEDEDVDLSYYSEKTGDEGLGTMSIEDYLRDLTEWDNERDDRLAGESRLSTMIRKEGNMLRRISRAPAATNQRQVSFLVSDPTWSPFGPSGSPLKHTSFLSADPTSAQPPSRPSYRQTLASVNESTVSVSSPLKSGFNPSELDPPHRPSLDSFRRDSFELGAPSIPEEAPPRPSWDSTWQSQLRKPAPPSALSNEPPVRSSWDNTWQHLWKSPGASALSKNATGSPLKLERSTDNLMRNQQVEEEPSTDGHRRSTDSYESDLGRPVSLYSLSDPVPRPLSPRASRPVSPPPSADPNTPSSSVPMMQNPYQPQSPPALHNLQIPTQNADQEKHVAFLSPTMTPRERGAPKLTIDELEMRDISMVSMNARPGKPSIHRLLHEEVENSTGPVVVACKLPFRSTLSMVIYSS